MFFGTESTSKQDTTKYDISLFKHTQETNDISSKTAEVCKRKQRRGQHTLLGQLDEIQFLALLWTRHMSRQERVHERLKVGAPPLCQSVADVPILVDALAAELRAHRREALVQAGLESGNFVVILAEVVAGPAVICIIYMHQRSIFLSLSFFLPSSRSPFFSSRIIMIIRLGELQSTPTPTPSDSTHSLKNAFAICSISTCGWLCSWHTSTPSHVRRMPDTP